MSAAEKRDFLVELGTEELPPLALPRSGTPATSVRAPASLDSCMPGRIIARAVPAGPGG